MKRNKVIFIIFLFIVLIALCNCSFAYVEVYITNTGSKYHTDGCQYLRKSKIAINMNEAIKKGYDPCDKCGAAFIVKDNDDSSTPESNKSSIPDICPNCNSTILEGNGQYCFECGYDLTEGNTPKNTLFIVSGEPKKTRSEYYNEVQSLYKTLDEKNTKISDLEITITNYENELSKKEDKLHLYIAFGVSILISIYISYNIGLYKNHNKEKQ